MSLDILNGVELGLSLDRYQELMRIPEAAFNGLYRAEDEQCDDCSQIWTEDDRDALAIAIAQAEQMREQELGYHVAPRYIDDEEYDTRIPVILRKKHAIAVGSKATDNIELNVAVVLAPLSDPIDIVVATTVTDTSEIRVYHPGTDTEIHPSKIVISGGNATISIPRSRLIKLDVETNCDPPPNYTDDANFETEVDVKRVYTDPSDGAFLLWFGGNCTFPLLGTTALSTTTQLCFPRITDYRRAIVELYPATYSAGVWTSVTVTQCRLPDGIRISYLSGIRRSVHNEMLTIGVTHTLLPELIPDRMDLCSGCWRGDLVRDPSDLITPYGMTTGAVKAWLADSRAKVGQGGKFPSLKVNY